MDAAATPPPAKIAEHGFREAELRDFFEIGWVTRRGLFKPGEIARMRACFDELERIAGGLAGTGLQQGSHFVLGEKDGERVIKRVVWAGACQPFLLEVGSDPRLVVPSAQLLRSDAMDHLLNQAHFKRPGDGVVFDWHQDIQHRDKGGGTWTDVNGTGSFVQTLIVLDEMTADSGPMLFMPGSAKWGRIDFGGDCADGYRGSAVPDGFRTEDAVTIAAEPGDTLFFGPYSAHASFENRSKQYRRVLINGYASPGANRREYPGVGAGRRLRVK